MERSITIAVCRIVSIEYQKELPRSIRLIVSTLDGREQRSLWKYCSEDEYNLRYNPEYMTGKICGISFHPGSREIIRIESSL